MDDTRDQNVNRRDLLKLGAAVVGAGLVGTTAARAEQDQRPFLGPAPEEPFAAPPMATVRIGFVGVGLQGSSHVRNLLRIPGVQLKAVCDIVPEKVERIQQWVVEAGQPKPTGYMRGETDFVRLCEQEDLDLVYTATPWEWHVPVLVAAMKNGKHGATEVPAAITIDECWQMVEGAEKHGKHCIMMENCNYDRPEMMVFNMVRQGLFGEVLHGECGYLHDLRGIKFEDRDEGLWRRAHSMTRNGNLYPTHGLGPVANCMDINRGDRFDYLVSMSGPVAGAAALGPSALPGGRRAAAGDVRARRREREPDPHDERPDDLPQPQHQLAAALQPHPHGAGHARAVPRLPEPRLRRGAQPRRRVGGPREVPSRSSSTRCGRTSAARRRTPATAAWTTWRTTV